MIADLARHHGALVALCRRHGVTRLDVFGSAAGDGFDAERSDVDFLVDLDPPAGVSRFDAYFGLKGELESLLRRPVDLVVPGALVNPYVAADVERTRTPVYAA